MSESRFLKLFKTGTRPELTKSATKYQTHVSMAQVHLIHLPPPPLNDPGEHMRSQTKNLLQRAAHSLQQAYADKAELGVEVEREIINLIRQFGEINKKTTDPFLKYNSLGAGVGLDVLTKFCTTYPSDQRFEKMCLEVWGLFARQVFDHSEAQELRLTSDLQSFLETIWPLRAVAFAGEHACLASVFRFTSPILDTFVL